MNRRNWTVARVFAAGILTVLAVISPLSDASADDTSLGRSGESVRPISDGQVEMAAEEVRVRVTPQRSYVECVFTFRNTGEACTVLTGFPEQRAGEDELGDDVGIHEFKAWVRGKPVEVRREKGTPGDGGKDYPFWWTWDVAFAPGETVEIRNTYWVRNTFVSNGDVQTGYILTTGNAWKGPIGQARVTFRFEGPIPPDIGTVFPGNYRFEGDSIVWQWEDFEPGADIQVVFNARPALFGEDPGVFEWDGGGEAGRLYWDIVNAGMRWDASAALEAASRLAALRGLPREAADEAKRLEARCRFLTGERAWGRPLWEPRIRSGKAAADDYYFLGSVYAASGDTAGLAELYRRARDLVPPGPLPQEQSWKGPLAVVRRWLAEKAPGEAADEFPDGDSAPVVEAVTVEPEDPKAPVAYVVRPVIRDSDCDLGGVTMKVWSFDEAGQRHEYILKEDAPAIYTGGGEAAPGFAFTPPSPFATIYYRITAVDSAGHTLDTGEIARPLDRVNDWTIVRLGQSPAPGVPIRQPVELRYHGEKGRAFAAEVSPMLSKALASLDEKLELRPCCPVVVRFYERSADQPPAAIPGPFPDYLWYTMESDATPGTVPRMAPDAPLVVQDILARVMDQNLGPAWSARASNDLPWLNPGLADFLCARDSKQARMAAELYGHGRDEFLRFARALGQDGGTPVDLLREIYATTPEDLEERAAESMQRDSASRSAWRFALILAGILAQCTLVLVQRRRSARP